MAHTCSLLPLQYEYSPLGEAYTAYIIGKSFLVSDFFVLQSMGWEAGLNPWGGEAVACLPDVPGYKFHYPQLLAMLGGADWS